MRDSYSRNINYIRLSITDRCNMRCRYCMPNDAANIAMSGILSYEEILCIAKSCISLGIDTFKITGGEPLVRRDCIDFMQKLNSLEGVREVTLTTNGVLLKQYAGQLFEAGIRKVNVSLDSVDPEEFKNITGVDCLDEVIEGIDAAIAAGILIKLNAVSGNASDVKALVEFAAARHITLRFIELMPIGYGKDGKFVSNKEIAARLEEWYGKSTLPVKKDADFGNGPAVYRKYEGLKDDIGFISAVHGKFCDSCNRVRLSSTGFLKPCLCYENGVDLRNILKQNLGQEELTYAIENAILNKPLAHCFDDEHGITEKRGMSKIGG